LTVILRSTAVTASWSSATTNASWPIRNNAIEAAALKLGFVNEEEFDRVVDPRKMVKPYVASAK